MVMFIKKSKLRTCTRCGHKWEPIVAHEPKQCPKCKSPYWDVARKKERWGRPYCPKTVKNKK